MYFGINYYYKTPNCYTRRPSPSKKMGNKKMHEDHRNQEERNTDGNSILLLALLLLNHLSANVPQEGRALPSRSNDEDSP